MHYHQDKSIKTDQPGLFSNNRRKVVKKMSILIKNESNMLLIISFTIVSFSQLSEQKSEKHISVLYHKTLNRFSLIQCHFLFLLSKI